MPNHKDRGHPTYGCDHLENGSSPLTHSLFGRYSASLSFPLVSPEKREAVSTCSVQEQEVCEGENDRKPPHTCRLESGMLSLPPSTQCGQGRTATKENKGLGEELLYAPFPQHASSLLTPLSSNPRCSQQFSLGLRSLVPSGCCFYMHILLFQFPNKVSKAEQKPPMQNQP